MLYAKIKKPADNARNLAGGKEIVSTYNLVTMHKGELREAITVRCYMGRSSSASVVHASIWVRPANSGNLWCSGYGSAGGYGYHKESAAIAIGYAIDSAGIELYGDAYDREADKTKRAYINGVGDSAIRAALGAIARAAGYRGKLLLVTN